VHCQGATEVGPVLHLSRIEWRSGYWQVPPLRQTRNVIFKAISRTILLVGLTACSVPTGSETLQSSIERQLSVNAQQYEIAGQAVLVLRNGKTLYRGSHGLADRELNERVQPDDIFPVFSVSKLLAIVLVMQLVEQGQLDLEAPASRYVPDLPERWRSMKVEDFLNHVSGLPEYFDASVRPIALPATREAAFKALADKELLFATGTDTRYTQTNFLVLAAILEARYHMPYRQIAMERIVAPLGLHDTYLGRSHVPRGKVVESYIGEDRKLKRDEAIDWPEYSIVHAELYSTVDDLGSFLNALCDERLLRRETLQNSWKPYRYSGGGGLGWFASGWEYGTSGRYQHVGHDGGAKVRVRLLFDSSLAQDTYAFIYLTNGSASNVWSRTLIESLMAIAAPGEFHDEAKAFGTN
jgi:D-alanyl-D-alanine carboxypeptidase